MKTILTKYYRTPSGQLRRIEVNESWDGAYWVTKDSIPKSKNSTVTRKYISVYTNKKKAFKKANSLAKKYK